MSFPSAEAPALLMSGGPQATSEIPCTACCKGKSYGVALIEKLKLKGYEVPKMTVAEAQTAGANLVAAIFTEKVAVSEKGELLVDLSERWKQMYGEYKPSATPCNAKLVGRAYLIDVLKNVNPNKITLDLGAEFASEAVKQHLANRSDALEEVAKQCFADLFVSPKARPKP